jgi:hypothetical protein
LIQQPTTGQACQFLLLGLQALLFIAERGLRELMLAKIISMQAIAHSQLDALAGQLMAKAVRLQLAN